MRKLLILLLILTSCVEDSCKQTVVMEYVKTMNRTSNSFGASFENPSVMLQSWNITDHNAYINYNDPSYYLKIKGDLILNTFIFKASGINIEVTGNVLGEPGSVLATGFEGFICVNGFIDPNIEIRQEGQSIYENCFNYDVDTTLDIIKVENGFKVVEIDCSHEVPCPVYHVHKDKAGRQYYFKLY